MYVITVVVVRFFFMEKEGGRLSFYFLTDFDVFDFLIYFNINLMIKYNYFKNLEGRGRAPMPFLAMTMFDIIIHIFEHSLRFC